MEVEGCYSDLRFVMSGLVQGLMVGLLFIIHINDLDDNVLAWKVCK